MKWPSDQTRGVVFVAAGILLVGLTFGASWAFSPNTNKITSRADANTTTLVGVQGPGWGGNVTALDSDGNVLWTVGNAISYQDVSLLDNGSVLATYADGNFRNCGQIEPPCKRTGVRFIDPTAEPAPKIVGQWNYPVRTRKNSEVHDAELLPSGELLVADMEYESIYTLNLTTKEQTWVWNASQYYDAPPDPTKTDWLHINDVDRIAPGRFLVSVRNTNQLLVVQRGEGVVEVINENRDPTVLNKQHNPQWLDEGSVLVADSENHRVVELHRDESTGEWNVIWSVYEVQGIHLDWPRDADRLPNGNTLITDSRNDRVVEITPNGSLVASYRVKSLPYEADRIPVGESLGRAYEPRGGYAVLGDRRLRVPVLSSLLIGIRHVVTLPYWVSELHLLVSFVGVVLCGWGGLLVLSGR
ncbi:hypothetical protein [Haladaptatus sp. NG-WS-4]